jgi:phosphopantothenoylcysteine decarboxylase/phosphopantothenate--cysteine ligase
VSNRSSGKMGFAVANAAALRGASVTLVAGPVALETPRNVKRIDVGSAEDMHKAVKRHAKNADAVIMAAAVADFTPAQRSSEKMKKDADAKDMELRLKPTADILQSLGRRKNGVVLVGFALETQNALRNAKAKLERKNLDLIALNTVDDENNPFGADTNRVTLIDRNGKTQQLQPMPKFDVANAILDRVKEFMRTR